MTEDPKPDPKPEQSPNPFSIDGYPLQVRHGELEVDFVLESISMCGQPLRLSRKRGEYHAFLSLYLRKEAGYVTLEQLATDIIAFNSDLPEKVENLSGIAKKALRSLLRKMEDAMVKSGDFENLEQARHEIEACYIHCKHKKGCKLLQLN